MLRRTAAIAAAAIGLGSLTSGCGSATANKAGTSTDTAVLRMASRDSDPTTDPAAAYFARRVGQLSGGALRIAVVPGWGSEKRDVEQQIVRAVAAGEVDLGVVGTRVFDTLGVASLQALTAPMLIDSYALERAVMASPLVGEMLEGVDRVGVTGIAVLGEGLRKPVAVTRPLLGPSGWRGITFAAYRSRGAAETIRALGARPTDVIASALDGALVSHQVQGFENDLGVYQSNARQYRAPYVTANVNLWPRTEALLGNPGRLSQLTKTEQGWLRHAAADAAARATGMFDHDAELAAELCESGARFASASPDELAALRRALRPVYARLELDPQTKAFIAEIRQLKRSTPSPALAIPAGCAGAPRTASPAAEQSPSALNGVYRVRWSKKALLAAGASRSYVDRSYGFLRGSEGVFTMTLRDGELRVRAPGAGWSPCPGTYVVAGTTLSITFRPPRCEGRVVARWSLDHGLLRLRVGRAGDPGDAIAFGAKPWTKIG